MPSSVGLVAGSMRTISEPCCRPLTDFAVQFGVVVFVCSKTDHGPDQQCTGTFWNTFAGFLLFENGGPVSFNDEKVSASIRDTRETLIELDLQSGTDHIRFYSSDLTAEYVRLNADYHT